jgi:hypothetical protein
MSHPTDPAPPHEAGVPSTIEDAPLDLFDDGMDDPPDERPARCQWCGTTHPGSAATCPDCGGRLLAPATADADALQQTIPSVVVATCPWCATPASPGDDTCRTCYANLRIDSEHVIPGVNVSLSDEQLRDLANAYRRLNDDGDPTGPLLDALILAARLVLGIRR